MERSGTSSQEKPLKTLEGEVVQGLLPNFCKTVVPVQKRTCSDQSQAVGSRISNIPSCPLEEGLGGPWASVTAQKACNRSCRARGGAEEMTFRPPPLPRSQVCGSMEPHSDAPNSLSVCTGRKVGGTPPAASWSPRQRASPVAFLGADPTFCERLSLFFQFHPSAWHRLASPAP